MVFLISTHTLPRFYKAHGGEPIKIESIEMTNKIDGFQCYPPVIANNMQAISELYKAGIPYYKTKKDAKEKAIKLHLSGFKYLKL